MLTSTGSRLFRFLVSLLVRLRLSVGRITLALRARFASLWRLILTFARRGGQSQIRLHASDVPVVDYNPARERPQISWRETAEEESSGTLAALPVRRPARWVDEISRYQDPTSSAPFEFDPHPATPEGGSQRYKPRRVRQDEHFSNIPAGQQTLLSALPPLPDGWRRHVHPEGSVIFYHEGLSDVIHHEREILFYATKLIQQGIDTNGDIMDELTEIVLNVDENRHWHYYFVDHSNRLLFWVHPVEQWNLGTDLQGITGYGHIRYLVEARYWSHCEYYPHNRTLPQPVLDVLRGMLNYAKTDMMTAKSSMSPFTKDELTAFLDLVNSLKDEKLADPYSIWIIARLLSYFTEDQFMHFCGQQCARLSADTPLFGQQTWNRGIMFNAVNVFLLGSPNEHAVRLKRVWVDDTIIQPRWKDFINRLTNELGQSYPILSTVMLAVNISFLAVPGVITAGSPASPIEIIIYCSVVSSIGSIVFSTALLKMYSDPGLMDASPAAEVMKTLGRTKWGMACFAIMHSLPFGCILWSITLFSAALATQIFLPKELSTCTTLGIECFILASFGFMSYRVMQLYSRNDYADEEEISLPTGSQHDVELGPGSQSGALYTVADSVKDTFQKGIVRSRRQDSRYSEM